MAKASKKPPEPDPASELVQGDLVATVALWGLVRRDAELEQRSESYIIRAILGAHYKLPLHLYNPPPRRRSAGDNSRG